MKRTIDGDRRSHFMVSHSGCAYRRRSGTVLLLVVAGLFLFLPLAGLVLHFGTVSMTRRQMQAASDVAAREALRLRDASTDVERRGFAADVTAALFDDDLDPSNGDRLQFGAGPTMTFSGVPPQLRIDSFGVYDPRLQPNLADDGSGDIVAGEYDASAVDHFEAGFYIRSDFTPKTGATSSPAILVRLRRSGETFSRDIGSSGPTVPQLFGRGPFGGPGLAGPGEIDSMTFAARGRLFAQPRSPTHRRLGPSGRRTDRLAFPVSVILRSMRPRGRTRH